MADEGVQRRPAAVAAAARGTARMAQDLDHKQTGEVYWGLKKLLEWLAGGEREQAHELEAAAAMAAEGARVARGGGTGGGLNRRSSTG
jgi:hypothetical protein